MDVFPNLFLRSSPIEAHTDDSSRLAKKADDFGSFSAVSCKLWLSCNNEQEYLSLSLLFTILIWINAVFYVFALFLFALMRVYIIKTDGY